MKENIENQKVKIFKDHIEIQATKSFTYDIEIKRIKEDTQTGRLNWIFHLRQKVWFTKEIENEFIKALKSLGMCGVMINHYENLN